MNSNQYSNLSDHELLAEVKKDKSSALHHAFFIGLAIGIIIYSIVMESLGWVTLILLYFVYKMINDPRKKKIKELEEVLKERNLN